MKARTKSIASPIGGWNARDALAMMPPTDAVKMENAFPNTTDVQLRKGSADHVTGISGKTVETLAAYNNATVSELYAFVNNAVYDVTTAGSVGSAESGTTITNGRWQFINFKVPTAAHWLMCVNGVDKPLFYDGTNWVVVTHTSTPAITGYPSNATQNIIHINEFKHRVWLISKESSSAYYLPTDSVGGGATEFDLAPVFNQGGFLMAMATWSIDAGSGLDDHAVFISSKGQVAVYAGTNPASADTFSLIGVFDIGSPVGRKCFIKFGGDLLVITQGGVVPLSKALINAEINQAVAITDKIRLEVTEAVTLYQDNFGWQLLQYPNANMLLLNVPRSTILFEQYVMNTITGSWCKFTGWNASCWELFNDEIYYGGSAEVRKAWSGNNDDGANITAEVIPAFNYFDSNFQKRFMMARPIFLSTGTPSILMSINTDYTTTAPTGTPSPQASTDGYWDVDKWEEASWGGDFQIQKQWFTVTGVGFSATLHIQFRSNASIVKWLSSDFVYENGAVI